MNKTWVGVGVVAILVVGVLGYMNKHAIKMMLMGSPTPSATDDTTASAMPYASSEPAVNKDIVTTMSDSKKGAYLVSSTGMTLYTYDKDTKGQPSVCSGGCAQAWPAYETATPAATLPTNVTVTKNADGSMQYAYKGWNLYYYANDTNPGDLTGDGVGGVWHLVKP